MFDKYLIVRWLLGNASVLKKAAELASGWMDAGSLSERLKILAAIIALIAPIVDTLPVLAAQCVAMSDEEHEADLVECQALGIPPGLISILLQLIIEILRMLTKRDA
jgi:hypothetical protein